MQGRIWAALGIGLMLSSAPSAVRADNYWEVEHARANARAGGPLSERDAELLGRYGCLSGTDNPFCESLRHGKKKWYRVKPRKRERD
jgi:hypothetical protein